METNKSKNLILILLFIVLIINISMMVTFFVFPRKDVKDVRIEKKIRVKEKTECLMYDLQLNESQEKEFFELRDEHKTKIKKMFSDVKTERNSLINAIAQEPLPSSEELYLYADAIGKMESDIQKETIDYFLKMKKLLNSEQFGKLINNFRDVCGCPHMKKDKHHHKKKSRNNDTCTRAEN